MIFRSNFNLKVNDMDFSKDTIQIIGTKQINILGFKFNIKQVITINDKEFNFLKMFKDDNHKYFQIYKKVE
jgi:hypothetical protein